MTYFVDFEGDFPNIHSRNKWINKMTGHRPFADLKKGWSPERLAANETRKAGLRSDLGAVDAYELGPDDYAEIPELTEEWFAKAQPHQAGRPTTPNRP